MPNHAHGIIVLGVVGAGLKPAPTMGLKPAPTTTHHGLPEIIRALKSFSSRRINESRQTPGAKIWQRNYWEHIVRNESEWNRIREYIRNNPALWELDKLHPDMAEGIAVGAGLKPAPTEIREPSPMYGQDAPRPNDDEAWMV